MFIKKFIKWILSFDIDRRVYNSNKKKIVDYFMRWNKQAGKVVLYCWKYFTILALVNMWRIADSKLKNLTALQFTILFSLYSRANCEVLLAVSLALFSPANSSQLVFKILKY